MAPAIVEQRPSYAQRSPRSACCDEVSFEFRIGASDNRPISRPANAASNANTLAVRGGVETPTADSTVARVSAVRGSASRPDRDRDLDGLAKHVAGRA